MCNYMTPSLSAGSSTSLVLLVKCEEKRETDKERERGRERKRGVGGEGVAGLTFCKRWQKACAGETLFVIPVAPQSLEIAKAVCLDFLGSTLKGHHDSGIRWWVCGKEDCV